MHVEKEGGRQSQRQRKSAHFQLSVFVLLLFSARTRALTKLRILPPLPISPPPPHPPSPHTHRKKLFSLPRYGQEEEKGITSQGGGTEFRSCVSRKLLAVLENRKESLDDQIFSVRKEKHCQNMFET